jgi:hypothetical protein
LFDPNPLPINNLVNVLSNIINIPLNDANSIPLNIQENVVCSLDHEDINNLEQYALENDHNEKCNICLADMLKDEQVTKLPCDHIYHCGCINEYLTNYNYKCPNCRKEVGKPKYNL